MELNKATFSNFSCVAGTCLDSRLDMLILEIALMPQLKPGFIVIVDVFSFLLMY